MQDLILERGSKQPKEGMRGGQGNGDVREAQSQIFQLSQDGFWKVNSVGWGIVPRQMGLTRRKSQAALAFLGTACTV